MFHDGEVMRDEKVSDTMLLLQILEQVNDLGLDGNIKRAHRFVTDDQLWLDSKGPGDANALALSTAEFVRVALGVGGIKANGLEKLGDSFLSRSSLFCKPMNIQGFAYALFNRHAWIERAVGILENELKLSPPGAEC
jgi:hypothetical protein